ncbi:MAG: M56 family metallopeptidase [Bryobacteraceae bacterium]|nr:M56 family metallopeptidase [Bryobacteraceae bacterium]
MSEFLLAAGESALRAGTILLLGAWMATSMMRRCSAAARHAVWVASVVGVVVAAGFAGFPAGAWAGWAAIETPVIRIGAARGVVAAADSPWIWAPVVWLGVAVCLLGRLAVSHAGVLSLARRARPLARRGERVQLVEGPAGCGPMSWGFLRQTIFLPAEGNGWPAAQREAVLLHELAHCQRGDCWWLLLARLVASVFWFQPLTWLALNRIASESERAADDAVLRAGISGDRYAGWLLQIARSVQREPAAATAMGRASGLERRLTAVLDERVNRRRFGRAGVLALAVGAAMILLPVVAAQKTEDDSKVYKIGDGITAPAPEKRVEPTYTQEAKDAKLEGAVLLSVEIHPDGRVHNAKVVRSLGKGLDEAAVAAVEQWHFKPAMKDGKPVKVMARIEVNFRLK